MAARQPDALHQGVIDLAIKSLSNGEALTEDSPGYHLTRISPREYLVHVPVPGRPSRDFVVKITEMQ